MKIHIALATILGAFLLTAPEASAQVKDDKPEKNDKESAEALAKSLKDADAIFTAEIGKVKMLGQTNSIPASVFGNITFKDPKMLLGKMPEGALSYGYREGLTKNLELGAEGKVLVAVKGKGVSVIVPATDANLALAKKAIEAAKEK